MIKKVFIVGGTGLIGRSLALKVRENFRTVQTSSKRKDKPWLNFDLRQSDLFPYEMLDKESCVVFLSAISSPSICEDDRNLAEKINIAETSNFIKKSLDSGAKIIFASSDAVYGNNKNTVDEKSNCFPVGMYAESKRFIEEKYAHFCNFKAIRLSYVFSADDKFTSYLRECHRNGSVAQIYNGFERAVIHIDDVVDGIFGLIKKWDMFKENFINFGGPRIISKAELAKEIFNYPALSGGKFEVVEAGADFFQCRPRRIAMVSPILETVLERMPVDISYAVTNEMIKVYANP